MLNRIETMTFVVRCIYPGWHPVFRERAFNNGSYSFIDMRDFIEMIKKSVG